MIPDDMLLVIDALYAANVPISKEMVGIAGEFMNKASISDVDEEDATVGLYQLTKLGFQNIGPFAKKVWKLLCDQEYNIETLEELHHGYLIEALGRAE